MSFTCWLGLTSFCSSEGHAGAEWPKACLQSLTGKASRDEIDKPCEAGVGLFVAGGAASECLETTEEVLDQIAPLAGAMG